MNGSSTEADGTAGIAEPYRSLPRYPSISGIIQGTVIRKERGRSRYTTNITDINPATLKQGGMTPRTHGKGIRHHGAMVSQTRPRKEVKGSLMTSAPFSLHPRREPPLAEIISSHNGQGKMRGAQILPQRLPDTGSGTGRWLFRRRSRSIGKNARNTRRRGAIRTPSSKVADHRRIPGGSMERGTTGGKQMGRNATGRASLHRSRDLSQGSKADRLFETVDRFQRLHS
jgi:hypothetical protein